MNFERERRERAASRYGDALRSCPAAGGGVHAWIMGAANHAAAAGVGAEDAVREIQEAMSRPPYPPGEVRETVARAYREHGERVRDWGPMPPPPAKPRPAPRTFASYVAAGADFHEAECWEASPIRLTWDPGWEDATAFLYNLFLPGDWVFCADTKNTPGELGRSVRRRDEWIAELARRGRAGEALPCLVMANPVSSVPAPTKDGRLSLRGDASVATLRNLVVENDVVSFPMQLAFWGGWGARHGWGRVRSMVHSGGKSIHVVFRVDAVGPDDWERRVKRGWVRDVFGPMGFDAANSNPGRMTRLPGHVRTGEDGGKTVQKLLFLNEGIKQ